MRNLWSGPAEKKKAVILRVPSRSRGAWRACRRLACPRHRAGQPDRKRRRTTLEMRRSPRLLCLGLVTHQPDHLPIVLQSGLLQRLLVLFRVRQVGDVGEEGCKIQHRHFLLFRPSARAGPDFAKVKSHKGLQPPQVRIAHDARGYLGQGAAIVGLILRHLVRRVAAAGRWSVPPPRRCGRACQIDHQAQHNEHRRQGREHLQQREPRPSATRLSYWVKLVASSHAGT